MSTTRTSGRGAAAPPTPRRAARPARPAAARRRLAPALAFDKIGAVYVWLVIIVVFSIWVPDTFPTLGDRQADPQHERDHRPGRAGDHHPAHRARLRPLVRVRDDADRRRGRASSSSAACRLVPAILAIGLAIGSPSASINATVVVVMKIDSFIGDAGDRLADPGADHDGDQRHADQRRQAGGRLLEDRSDDDRRRDPARLLLRGRRASSIWYLLEHTATGRRLYATGFNPDAARLAGVPVDRLRFMSLRRLRRPGGRHRHRARLDPRQRLADRRHRRTCSRRSPRVFLGATQLKNGRFNAGGTIIAVLLLGTGTTGLALAAAPQWSQAMFVGVVLIAALAVTGIQRRTTVAQG